MHYDNICNERNCVIVYDYTQSEKLIHETFLSV